MSLFDKWFLTVIILSIFGLIFMLSVSIDNVKDQVEKIKHRVELVEDTTPTYTNE